MTDHGPSLVTRLRGWLAGIAFTWAGRLDPAYDVWLDDAPRRGAETDLSRIQWLVPDDDGTSPNHYEGD